MISGGSESGQLGGTRNILFFFYLVEIQLKGRRAV
jgi:hypothetical protein